MEAKMKAYSVFSKVFVIICIIGILLVVFNYFTGSINSKLTAGASVICLNSFIIALYAANKYPKFKKNK
jgi:hypothetical protein